VRWGDLAWALLGETVTVRGGERVARDLTLPLGTITLSTGITVNGAGVQVFPRDRGFPPTWQCLSGLLMNSFCGPPSLLEEFERDFWQDGTLPPNVTMPRLVERSVPEYPAALVGLGVEGDVTLEGRIGTHGFIDDLRLLGASNSALVESSLAAARGMRWEPARIQDVPTETPIRLDVEFRIQQ
jgi:TonB family protein